MRLKFVHSASLMWKALSFLFLISVIIAGCFFVAYTKQAKEFDDYNKSAIASVIEMFKLSVNDYVVTGDSDSLSKIVDHAISNGLIHGITVSQLDKIVFIHPSKLDLARESTRVTVMSSVSDGVRAEFSIFLNQQSISGSKSRFMTWAVFFICCVLTTIAVIGYYIRSKIVKPLLRLSASAQSIAKGNYAFEAPNCSNDEIGLLTHSLENMSNNLKLRVEAQENYIRELVNAHGKVIIGNHDRTRYLDTLINDTSPYLTEALVTLQSLSDRPLQQGLINRVLLFVVAQLEQARSLIDESNVPLELDLEKFSLEEFSKIVNEYGMFFSRTRNIQIDFRLKCDPFINTKEVFFLIDTKLLIKMFSLIFEIMSAKLESAAPLKSTILLDIDNIGLDKADLDITIKNDYCFISNEECHLINSFFSKSETAGCELDELPLSSRQNKLAFQSLKSLADYLKADYTLNYINDHLESRFRCRIWTCKESESIADRVARQQLKPLQTNAIFVGSAKLVAKSHVSKGQVKVVNYDSFISLKELVPDTNYVIDHITQKDMAVLAIRKFGEFGLRDKNLAVLANPADLNDELIDFFYEHKVDLIIHGYLDAENLKNICSSKIRVRNEESLVNLIGSCKG
ncbi:MAG: HAMP domain-containing protein [Gammaproteobacteria bacterium]|nr:MAG: HAMP domain-containing protein [Gammaproteobacteria bacterium]